MSCETRIQSDPPAQTIVTVDTKTTIIESNRGEKGEDGVGMPEGGEDGQVLTKVGEDDYDYTWQDPLGEPGEPGEGVPVGGATGQVLAKLSGADFHTNWEDQQQGPQGPQGEQGEQGEKGDKGDQGDQGPQGLQGIQGVPGVDGADGSDGQQGAQGVPGTDGLDGAPGQDGADGEGVPVGGDTGQVLAKVSGADFNANWVDPSGSSSNPVRLDPFFGTDDGSIDDPAFRAIVDGLEDDVYYEMYMVGTTRFLTSVPIEKNLKLLGTNGSWIKSDEPVANARGILLFRTSERTSPTSTQSLGVAEPNPLQRGLSSYRLPQIPVDWDVVAGEWMTISGATDPRPRPQNNTNDASYGEPIKVAKYENSDLYWQGVLREDVPVLTENQNNGTTGNIYFGWRKKLKGVGVENINFDSNGSYAVKFCDCQDFTLKNITNIHGAVCLIEACYEGVVRDCRAQSDDSISITAIRMSYACADITVDNCTLNSNGNCVDGAGGAGLPTHKDIQVINCKFYDHSTGGTTAPLRVHAAGGGIVFDNISIESNNDGSQGSACVVEGIYVTISNCRVKHYPIDDTKPAILFQAGYNKAINNATESIGSGIAVSTGTLGITEEFEIRGNTCKHSTPDGSINSNSKGISLGSTINLIFSDNVVVTNNVVRGYDIGYFNAGDETSNNRFSYNTAIDCNSDTKDATGSPGSPTTFQYTTSLKSVQTATVESMRAEITKLLLLATPAQRTQFWETYVGSVVEDIPVQLLDEALEWIKDKVEG